MLYPKQCEIKVVIIIEKIEFWILYTYTSYKKMLQFKFVDLHVENNFF